MTAYHGVNKRQPPKPDRLPRHREITERSRIFNPGAIDAVNGTELIHIWLEHLLVLSMLQHPKRQPSASGTSLVDLTDGQDTPSDRALSERW